MIKKTFIVLLLLIGTINLFSQTPSRGAKDNLVHQFRGLVVTDTVNVNNVLANKIKINNITPNLFLALDSFNRVVTVSLDTSRFVYLNGLRGNIQKQFDSIYVSYYNPVYTSLVNCSSIVSDSVIYIQNRRLVTVYASITVNTTKGINVYNDGTFSFTVSLPLPTFSHNVYGGCISYQSSNISSSGISGFGLNSSFNTITFSCNGNYTPSAIKLYYTFSYLIM